MANKQKILIVDDDANIANLISLYLTKECFDTRTEEDGQSALNAFKEYNPDLVLLDIMLPGIDGYEVCREIRKESKVPIIMLSAKTEVFDKVLGLELGADDYVVKPFDLVVLYSRILALLRRTEGVTHTKLFCDDLILDKEKTAVYNGQKEIVVSQPEYRILLILMENKGKTITRNQLLEQVWDRSGNYVNDNTLTVTMKRLREKLNHPACLKTIRSFGYRMEDTQ